MNKTNHQSIIIDAKIKTTLENMDNTVSKLQKGLKEGVTNLDMTKGIGSSLSKALSVFKDEFKHFSDLTKSGSISLIDTKEMIRSGEKIIQKYREIERITGNLNELQLVDAKKLFPDAFNQEIGDLRSKLSILSQDLNNLEIKKIDLSTAEAKLTALNAQVDELKAQLIDAVPLQIATDEANTKLANTNAEVEKIRAALKDELKLKLDTADLQTSQLDKQIKDIEAKRSTREVSKLAIGSGGHVTYEGKTAKQWEKSGASQEQISAAQAAISAFAEEEKQLKSLRIALKTSKKKADVLREAFGKFDENTDLIKTAEQLGKSSNDIENVKNALLEQANAAEQAERAQKQLSDAQDNNKSITKRIETTTKQIEEQEQKVSKLTLQYNNLVNKTDTSKLQQALQKALGEDFTPDLLKNKQSVDELLIKLRETDTIAYNNLMAELNKIKIGADMAEDQVGELREGLSGVSQTSTDIARAASEMDNLKRQVLDFFSLTNSVQLFRRAITNALNTVKELDATMTEAAVVTDFSIDDMWGKLPQYTAEAQKLGISINGMYQATTLYYQQGLKTNAAMELGVETMKMAKIAGMESAEATKAMTSALRGFNMELNETSAQRVNDVYSELAAVTAADAGQIATAMEKTASIAASARMEFETTSALLAQIIETTQEAPETAGTAMKTIIARFSEVKELKEQGLFVGQDTEGEAIDVNKIQTALRSVGVSMTGFFEGTEGLDSVLLKLAEKWDGLDVKTQRYIATMAAGSRQQSRFIAMMSNYARTTELVNAAQNSAGASQRQFNKTLDSMESKLQKLENAWKEFLMGLSNNTILKAGIDLITDIIEGINKATKALSGGNGLIKSVASLALALAGLKAGKNIFNSIFGKLMPGQIGGQATQNFTGRQRFQQARGQGKSFKSSVGAFLYDEEGQNTRIQQSVQNRITGAQRKHQKKNKLSNMKTDEASRAASVDAYREQIKQITAETKEDTSDLQAIATETYERVLKETGNAKLAAEAANKEIIELGGSFQQSTKKADNFASKITSINFQGLSQGAMVSGGALMALSSIFEQMGQEGIGDIISKIGTGLMATGTILSIFPPLIKLIEVAGVSAGKSIQAAFGWISLIATVAISVVSIFGSLFKKSKSIEEKIADTTKRIDQMKDSAKEAENALQEIAETRTELEGLQDTFKGLVKGTDDWRKALVKSNSQVLELLDKYPELINYISTDEDGLMKISSEGYNMITKRQNDAFVKTTASAQALELKKIEQQKEQNRKRKGLSDTERAAREKELGVQAQATATAYYNSIIATDKNLAGSELSQFAANVMSYDTDLEDEISNLRVKKSGKKYSKSQKQDLEEKYAELTGKSEKEIEELIKSKDISYSDIDEAVAASLVGQSKATQMKNITKAISKQDKENQDILKKMFTKDGKGLKKYDIDTVNETVKSKGGLEEYLKSFEIHLEEDQLKGLEEALSNVTDAFGPDGPLVTELKQWGLNDGENGPIQSFITEQSYGAAYEFTQKFGQMIQEGRTTEDVNNLIDQVDNLTKGLAEEDQSKVMEYLADTNWKSEEDIATTLNLLSQISGIDITKVGVLGESIDELANATSENTVAQLQNQKWLAEGIKDRLLSGELDENRLTTEEKDELKKNIGAQDSDFRQIGLDEWMYKGDLYSKVVNLYTETTENQSESGQAAIDKYQNAVDFSSVVENGVYKDDIDKIISGDFQLVDPNTAQPKEGAYYGTYADYLFQKGYSVDDENGAEYSENELVEKYNGEFYKDWQTAREIAEYNNQIMNSEQENFLYRDKTNYQKLETLYTEMAAALGLTSEEGLTAEEMMTQIQDWYKEIYTGKEGIETNAKNKTQSQLNAVAGSLNQSVVDMGYLKFEDIVDQVSYAEDYKEAIDDRLKATGGSVYFDDLEEQLKKTNKASGQFITSLKGLASDLAVSEAKTITLAENMSKLSDGLSSDKNSIEYGKALALAEDNVASYFEVDQKYLQGISDDLYLALANGDSAALQQIQDIIAKNVLNGYKIGLKDGSEFILSEQQASEMAAYLQVNPFLDKDGMKEFKERFGIELTDLTTEAQAAFNHALSFMNAAISFGFDKEGNIVSMSSTSLDRRKIYDQNYGSGSSSSKYENPYDKLHNTLEEINDLLRERERLERRYQNLINRGTNSITDLQKARDSQLTNIEAEIALQKEVIQGRNEQIDELLSKNSRMQKYVQLESLQNEERSIRIDWAEIEKVRSSSTGEKIDEFYDKLKEYLESIYEAEKTIADSQDAQYDLLQEGQDEYFDIEDQIKEAIIESYQKQIDELSNINDSISDTNSQLLDAMQEQLDEYRQNRDNQKTEEEISDKQRRLAYLQQDTSGANTLEILQLQKEIDEAQEDYTDTLIDQKISELQKQNDLAAEQRQRQIDIAQAQLEHYDKTGKVWEEVNRLLSSAIGPNGEILPDSKLMELLKEINNYEGLSELGRMKWLEGIETMMAQAFTWRKGEGVLPAFWEGKDIDFTTKDGKVISGRVQANGDVIGADGSTYENVKWQGGNSFITDENSYVKEEQAPVEPNELLASQTSGLIRRGHQGEQVKAIQRALQGLTYNIGSSGVDGNFGPATERAVKQFQAEVGLPADGIVGSQTREEFKLRHYQTGGLANFTGPAWLDGTKSKPEYILNAEQTKAFFSLVDVLSSLQTKPSQATEKTGDNTFDIDINVESIGSDYDVEQLAETVKRLINDDARYRNNNAINLMR